jgi:hypothetical protein
MEPKQNQAYRFAFGGETFKNELSEFGQSRDFGSHSLM